MFRSRPVSKKAIRRLAREESLRAEQARLAADALREFEDASARSNEYDAYYYNGWDE